MLSSRIVPDLKPQSLTVVVASQAIPEELVTLLHRNHQAGGEHERALFRWGYVSRGVIADASGATFEFWTHDLNRCTLGFVSDRPIARGLLGPVRFDLPNGGRFETRARVMRGREFALHWYEGYLIFTAAAPPRILQATIPPPP